MIIYLPDVQDPHEIRNSLGGLADSLGDRQRLLVGPKMFRILWGEQLPAPVPEDGCLIPANFSWTGKSHEVRVFVRQPDDLVIFVNDENDELPKSKG